MDSFVSVVCLTHNHEKYVRDALEGFIRQRTDFPFQVLVHDDASTDGTAAIIREYEQRYPKIIRPIYQKENQYSKGVRISKDIIRPLIKGKYVAVCEGDDYWTDPLKLQKQADFMESHPDYSLCCSLMQWFDETEQKFIDKDYHKGDCDVSVEDCIMSHWHGMQTAGMFVRSDVNVLFPEWRQQCPVTDYPRVINAALHGKVRVLGEVMAVYRQHVPNSWTYKWAKEKDFYIQQADGVIRSLQLLNVETEGKYNEVINRKIEQLKLKITKRSGMVDD